MQQLSMPKNDWKIFRRQRLQNVFPLPGWYRIYTGIFFICFMINEMTPVDHIDVHDPHSSEQLEQIKKNKIHLSQFLVPVV